MAMIELVFNQYFLIAQLLNLLSYSQSNFLILRLLFIGSSLFFVIFTVTSSPIVIDVLLFNFTFFVINIWRSIPLLLDLVPPKLSSEQETMYNEYFYRYLRRQEFKILFAYASRQVYRISCSIVKPGNGFSSIFFVPKIPEDCKVILNNKQGDYTLNSFSWVGILEFLELISEHNKLSKKSVFNNKCFWRMKLRVEINEFVIPEDFFYQQLMMRKEIKDKENSKSKVAFGNSNTTNLKPIVKLADKSTIMKEQHYKSVNFTRRKSLKLNTVKESIKFLVTSVADKEDHKEIKDILKTITSPNVNNKRTLNKKLLEEMAQKSERQNLLMYGHVRGHSDTIQLKEVKEFYNEEELQEDNLQNSFENQLKIKSQQSAPNKNILNVKNIFLEEENKRQLTPVVKTSNKFAFSKFASSKSVRAAVDNDVEELDRILFNKEVKKKDENARKKNEFNSAVTFSAVNKEKERPQNNFLLNNDEDFDLGEEQLVIYEFDLAKLEKVFNGEENGCNIMKALYSMWLEMCSDVIKKKNEKNRELAVESRRNSTFL